ncbi:sorting nexin-21 [Hypomesus transpacificus]|uniref:sorting nexin-21 n=1 Tax=Hypomesus transpacificus TaxID=137520 RepID=UPI001F0767BE|nr:sorting nexin-21 [Hypomesus transpacificus]
MASRLLDRLRRSFFRDGDACKDEDAVEDFPESSELEDDTECVSERLGGTLCFDGSGGETEEAGGEGSGADSDSDFLGESLDEGFISTDASPVGLSPSGPSLLTRQLQESWRSLRGLGGSGGPGGPAAQQGERLLFEVTDACVVQDGTSKYVLYTILVIQSGLSDKTPAVISRRYSDFERLHARLRRRHGDEMQRVCFPRKKLRRNYVAETIAKRSRAFEQYLSHLHSLPGLRGAPCLREFFYLGDLQAGQALLRVGQHQEALGPLLNARRLQEKLGQEGQQASHWLFTVLGLVCCFQAVEQLEEAAEHCDLALQELAPPPSQEAVRPSKVHPQLMPLLQITVRLSWKLSRDKRRWEALLQQLQEAGVDPAGQPSLQEYLVKESLLETDQEHA